MKTAKLKISVIVIGLSIFVSQSILAAYSAYGTFQVASGSSQTVTTNGKRLGETKTTTANTVSFISSYKSMWTDPTARIVNSNGSARSGYVEIKTTSDTYTASNNTGDAGYKYYAQVKADPAQLGTDSITLKFNPK